ncbi:FliA/WhiG family RNA polymerase sigma factor [Clostridium sediminicola]|uniref:sigma-70 family RNA polymerase sigma factor n=1 Tax=Clostridium sediminicola TaxID=3114879 RepID=UPI0031F27501
MENSKREEMIIKHLPLVQKISRSIKLNNNMSITREDLYSVGIIGLMEAVDKYDCNKNVTFPTYATLRIKGAMIDEIRKQSNISRGKVKKINEYNNALNQLRHELLREPKDNEISSYLNINIQELYKIKNSAADIATYYLEKSISPETENETSLKDLLIDTKQLSPEDDWLLKEKKLLLANAVEQLPEREKIILNLIYKEELSLKEIAYVMEISISRVSQIHGRALKRLRVSLENRI